jgi:predicted membrane-bound spermidine synthase
MRSRQSVVTLLVAAFFLSGFGALLYQVSWQRMIGLFSGSDIRSVTIVVGAYLGGLGLGSLVGGLGADRLRRHRALQAFSLSNYGIALFAVASRFLYYDLLYKQLAGLARLPSVLFLVVFASLLWPTFLMGLSLPLLSKALVQDLSDAPRLIGILYGINTLGAGTGAFIASWVLIGNLGYDGAVYAGAVLSAVVGTIAWTATPYLAGNHHASDVENVADRTHSTPRSHGLRNVPRQVYTWSALVFVSGFIAVSLELIWFRLLDFSLKSSAYTFGHVLAFFLIGDALGVLYGARIVGRIKHPRQAFLLIQGLVVLLAILGVLVLIFAASSDNSLFALYLASSQGRIAIEQLSGFNELSLTYLYFLFVIYILVPVLVLVPPAFLLGLYYPIVQKAVQTDYQVVAQRVGLISMANIVGNTAGSVITGLVLLQFAGTVASLRLIGGLGLVLIAMLLWEERTAAGRASIIRHGILVMSLATVILALPSQSGFWSAMHGASEETTVYASAEDSTGVAAIRPTSQEPQCDNIWVNGRPQGCIERFDAFHAWLGALPALLHPNPRQVMAVGIGSANSPYAVGLNPNVERIYAVEIIGPTLELLTKYAQEDHNPALKRFFDDPRYEIIIGDGRREIALSNMKYDIIVTDALLPWTSHSGLLYSREYYELLRDHLADGGLVVQWRPHTRAEATFLDVFSYVMYVEHEMMIGSNDAIPFDQNRLLSALDDPQVTGYLAAGGVDIAELQGWIRKSPSGAWEPHSPRPPKETNTDLFPKDEYYLNNPY